MLVASSSYGAFSIPGSYTRSPRLSEWIMTYQLCHKASELPFVQCLIRKADYVCITVGLCLR